MKIDPAEVARMTVSGIENADMRKRLGEAIPMLAGHAAEILKTIGADGELLDRTAGQKALEAVELLGRRIMERRL